MVRKGQIETPADNILGVGVYSKKERGHVTAWKLADFGIAKMLTREAQEAYYGGDAPGVPTYMGPEVLKDYETYSASSDVWSMGLVIAFYMRNGRHVFNCNDDVLYYEPGMASDMIFTDECYNNYSPELIRLVSNMIQVTLRLEFACICMPMFNTLIPDPAPKKTNSTAGFEHVHSCETGRPTALLREETVLTSGHCPIKLC